MNDKSVKIDQLVDFEVYELALIDFLNDRYSQDYVIEQLRLNINGDNRIKKGLRLVDKIITRSPLNELLQSRKQEVLTAMTSLPDKQIIVTSLLNASFPFAFNLQRIFGKFFNVQDVINIKVIQKEISKVYGGNRVAVNGIYCVGPVYEKADFYDKEGVGLYKVSAKKVLNHDVSLDIMKATYGLMNKIDDPSDNDLLDPYFFCVQYY
tara:strand:+ start:610 stop:1233 length:624 start_codon:yes stop_codon:yes gene_type:complete